MATAGAAVEQQRQGPGEQVQDGGSGRGRAASEVPGLFKLVSANIESLDARLPVIGEDPFRDRRRRRSAGGPA